MERAAGEQPEKGRNDWKRILAHLKHQVNPQSFETWFKPTRLDHLNDGAGIFVRVPSAEFREWIETNFSAAVSAAISELGLPYTNVVYLHETPEENKTQPEEKAALDFIPRKAPRIPEECWTGLYKAYREAVTEHSECSDNFHFAGFGVAVACGLGKSVYMNEPEMLYPNIFACMVGQSNDHKGTAQTFSTKTLLPQAGVDVCVMNSLSSAEGVISLINRKGQKSSALLIRLTELRKLLAKLKEQSAGGLVTILNDLYDCVDSLENPTKNSYVECSDPPPGVFFAGTTPEWMRDLQEHDLTGGTGNRLLFFPGESKPPIPRAKPPMLHAVSSQLRDIFNFWRSRNTSELRFTGDANALWDKWYCSRPTLKCSHALIRSLAGRDHLYVRKFAMQYAALDQSEYIEIVHLKPAIALFDQYLFPALWHLFSDFSLSPFGRLEQQIVDMVREASAKGQVRVKDLLHRFDHGRWERWAVRKALENVAGKPDDSSWDGDLKIITCNRRRYVAPNDD